MADQIFVPGDLLELCGLDGFRRAARARRLLVTMWVQLGNTDRRSTDEDVANARWVWGVAPDWLDRASRVTVLSVLLQLKAIDAIQNVDEANGGYLVTIHEEARCA